MAAVDRSAPAVRPRERGGAGADPRLLRGPLGVRARHVFPILWNLDGDVVESFAPDFYLPGPRAVRRDDHAQAELVRKKNRKLRRLRELYPDIRIKLFYAPRLPGAACSSTAAWR